MKKIIMIFGILSLLLFGCINQSTNAVTTSTGVGSANVADMIKIPISDISTTIKYYTFSDGGVNVRYFVVKGSDGNVHTAFDACEVCYKAKKGYSQIGDSVKCNNCGLTFKINGLGTQNKGKGCWPGYLPHEVKGTDILIKESDLKKGKYMFS